MSDSGDPEFEALERSAYELLFRRGHTAESALRVLNTDERNETLVEMAIESAHTLRHEQALRGELDWTNWLVAIARDPGRSGRSVTVLTILTLIVTYFAVVWSIGWFPPGHYPRLILMLPGLFMGVAFFAVASLPIYVLLQKRSMTHRQEDRR